MLKIEGCSSVCELLHPLQLDVVANNGWFSKCLLNSSLKWQQRAAVHLRPLHVYCLTVYPFPAKGRYWSYRERHHVSVVISSIVLLYSKTCVVLTDGCVPTMVWPWPRSEKIDLPWPSSSFFEGQDKYFMCITLKSHTGGEWGCGGTEG